MCQLRGERAIQPPVSMTSQFLHDWINKKTYQVLHVQMITHISKQTLICHRGKGMRVILACKILNFSLVGTSKQ